MQRTGNPPGRRIAPAGTIPPEELSRIAALARYGGSAPHKLRVSDYGFHPPVNPRPNKSVCDDLRPVHLAEASALLTEAIRRGMVSRFANGSLPKYVWAVSDDGKVFEAKTKPGQETVYHGYRLGDDERDMTTEVQREWNLRRPA